MLAGRDTLAILPTGAGKSLCYQLPAVLFEGTTLVVSPLIALMKDQADQLEARGIEAAPLNSSLSASEEKEAMRDVRQRRAEIVFATPERLQDAEFLEALRRNSIDLFVVDEAHCISQWGHDFRPAFLDIGPAVPALGKPTVLALTATATEDVARDIDQQLGIPRDGIVHTGSYRPNLALKVEQVAREEDKLDRALTFVRGAQGSGLVYTATVKAAIAVHELLEQAGESVGLYHGKLSASDRKAAQDAFMNGERRVMVATNAFGLGIDKPDIRFVLHYQLPPGLEAYYQEAGRAGRDGQASLCTLLYLRADKAVQQFFLAGRYPTDDDAAALYQALQESPGDDGAWTLPLLQARLGRPRSKVQVALGLLRRQKIVGVDAEGGVRLLKRGLAPDALGTLMTAYRDKRESDRETLERMVFYAQTGQCRWRVLLEHLEGEAPFERCKHCDNCLRIARQEEALARAEEAQVKGEAANDDHAPARAAFAAGDIVQVKRYGRGEVREATALEVTVTFADGSRRTFHPEFVRKAKAVKQAVAA